MTDTLMADEIPLKPLELRVSMILEIVLGLYEIVTVWKRISYSGLNKWLLLLYLLNTLEKAFCLP